MFIALNLNFPEIFSAVFSSLRSEFRKGPEGEVKSESFEQTKKEDDNEPVTEKSFFFSSNKDSDTNVKHKEGSTTRKPEENEPSSSTKIPEENIPSSSSKKPEENKPSSSSKKPEENKPSSNSKKPEGNGQGSSTKKPEESKQPQEGNSTKESVREEFKTSLPKSESNGKFRSSFYFERFEFFRFTCTVKSILKIVKF